MYKVIVFAGTTEGYEISRFLSENQLPVLACVATEYGSKSLQENSCLHVQAGRLDEQQMRDLFFREKPELVLDATHPYAAEVTQNIRKACEETGVSYTRILRTGSEQQNAVYVRDAKEAAEYLEGTEGNVLLTTGSKELAVFTSVSDYNKRLFARVLSLPSVIESCQALGFEGRNLIAMQGPFSKELNQAMLEQYQCKYLVTKDSGKAGGFLEKIQAAEALGVTAVIIGRPLAEEGLSLKECRHMLIERYGLKKEQNVTLLGIGMGSIGTLTLEGREAVRSADLIVGARRMVDAVRLPGQDFLYEYRSRKIAAYLAEHPEYTKVVVALSGDVGFYSGAKKLVELLGPETKMICGISSVVYFMSKIGLSWDDAKIVSAHGKTCNLISLIRENRKVFAILGTNDGVRNLAEKLTFYGMGDVILHVGENLSYDNEKILSKQAKELVSYEGDPLSVICAYNLKAEPEPATHGLSDEEFIRGKAPMTKAEVRTVSLAKLRLSKDAVCYDIGAGTGSVSVEMALRASEGEVYAIEKKEDALALLAQNKKKFALDHMYIIPGTAPEALEELPVPTHAFIGGSSGNMKEIVGLLIKKNPQVRIVINCITLETVGEALGCIRELAKQEGCECENEIVQLCVSRSKNIGRYHMMMGENPIYIITVQMLKTSEEVEEQA